VFEKAGADDARSAIIPQSVLLPIALTVWCYHVSVFVFQQALSREGMMKALDIDDSIPVRIVLLIGRANSASVIWFFL